MHRTKKRGLNGFTSTEIAIALSPLAECSGQSSASTWNKAPECLSFCYGSHGKPALVWESGGDAIRFNISHSDGVALYAVTRGREVGIDLELVRRGLEIEEIAERFFSRLEIATLRALPTPLRRYAFFLCWTRKEAYIKARGEGLSLPLDQFDVSLIPGEPATLMSTRPDSDEALSLVSAGV